MKRALALTCLMACGGASTGAISSSDADSEVSDAAIARDAGTVGSSQLAPGVFYYGSYGHDDDAQVVTNAFVAGGLFQIYWSEIETADGVFDWQALDTRIKVWSKAKKVVALRVMWSSSGYWPDPRAKTPTPAWLATLGAKNAVHPPSGTRVPLVWDPIYFSHALRFLEQVEAHFANNPAIAFIDITPGAETNPYRFGTLDEKDPGFRAVFLATKASDGTTYTDVKWAATLEAFIRGARQRMKAHPLLVTLNNGAMPDAPSRLEATGELAVSLGISVGQNGLRGDSYTTANSAQRWLGWAAKVPLFFEMSAATGGSEGTMQEVVDAALRVRCSALNTYAIDVVKATKGSSTYDPAWEAALQQAARELGGSP